jgi:molybdopterin synthase sulfur carrier subunit
LSVKINLPFPLRHLINDQAVVEVSGNTIGQCLEQLVARFPRTRKRLLEKNGRLSRLIDIYVNGESTYPEELATAVKDGDELHIEVKISGG